MPADPVPDLLFSATQALEAEFRSLPPYLPSTAAATDAVAMARILDIVAWRLGDNYPYFHPLYAGQMLKPPHPIARAAYALAMTLNPNNHALDGGRASSQMEIEAVAEIAAMFGWGARKPESGKSAATKTRLGKARPDKHAYLGHLTSSGTMANLEALWVAGQLEPGKRILASEQAHYTHQRISSVLKLPFTSVKTDSRGRISLEALEDALRKGDVGAVVVTLGTTAVGAVDPLDQILELRRRYKFRIHVDAAYGGYFRLIAAKLDDAARASFDAIDQADSIVVDPHKHGLQPYGCGCILFRDPGVGRFYKHDSPYTYFTSKELHLGEISLECSRAGAAAVALWATQQLLPLTPDGDFARGLAQGHSAALDLDSRLRRSAHFQPLAAGPPELDIAVWKCKAASLAASSALAHKTFVACAKDDLHLALVQLPHSWFRSSAGAAAGNKSKTVTCLRSVLMKP